MKKILLAALLATVATGAFAADLPSKKNPPAMQPIYTTPAFSWTGFYLGVNGGYGFGSMSNTRFGNPSGALIGGTAGYNYQIGQVVVGAEGDYDFSTLRKSNTIAGGTTKFTTNGGMMTARLRAGYAIDRALLYVTGGYAGIDTNGSFVLGGATGAQESWRNGGVIGGGVEYAFTNNISAKAEYLYAPMSSKSYFAGTPIAENSGLAVSVARLGLNYKF